MNTSQKTMKAITMHGFGGADVLAYETVSLPLPGDEQIVLQVAYAGVGKWDIYEREGLFAQMLPGKPTFPYILGSEGSGKVVAVGKKVTRFKQGDMAYGMVPARSPKAGFYAEYVAVDTSQAWLIPSRMTVQQAAALALDGGTALRGLQDTLQIGENSSLMIIGASGGVGHLAVQIAKHMGARVFAVASGEDGVQLALSLGADTAVDGKTTDVVTAARQFAPNGIDAALVTAGGPTIANMLHAVTAGGRIAYPNVVRLDPSDQAIGYNADYDTKLMNQLNT
ncbi:MAG TPA: NADP-dependent oxidoreductase, partial [Patescibacteria group bacterium]|nr:NADP-dependent oxidoreductase [Patescibacteria group bacterium]